MRRGLGAVVVAVILGLSIIITARIFSDTAISIKNKGNVNVKGYAKKQISSDLAIFEATVIEENKDLKVCYDQLSKDKKKVESFLKGFGIELKEIEFFPAEIRERFKTNEKGYATEERVAFKLYQGFRIESKDVYKIEKLAADVVGVLGEGVQLTVKEPKFINTKIEELKIEMIGRATANAKDRAQTVAKQGKFRLGPISSVRIGVFQITPLHSTEISDYGMNDTSSIEKEIKSVVEIEYFVK
ncbi:MAG: SIMPL domain-containing protein [Candidatus Omnitrophica bacterium]|nr:SIMPL domain-containing protein [Candidatus Omnitrophota bacterium]MBU1925902.1 SIMPL domain-containing protein [Candidatus Omnitrophota bacterium]